MPKYRIGRIIIEIGDFARSGEFGYPCGSSFISDRHKCYRDPKNGSRLKKPITRSIYDRIIKSKGKAAQSLYRDRETAIRAKRSDDAKGWKKSEIKENKPMRGVQYIDGDISLDSLGRNFRGVVAVNRKESAFVGLKGQYSDKDSFKNYLPNARWYPAEKAWMVKLNNNNQREIFKAVQLAKAEMNLPDVAFEGRRNELGNGIIGNFKRLGIVVDRDKPKDENKPRFL